MRQEAWGSWYVGDCVDMFFQHAAGRFVDWCGNVGPLLATKGGKASAIFRHYDEDKSGALSYAEFRKAIESLNIQARAPRREPLALPPGDDAELPSPPNRSRSCLSDACLLSHPR